MKRIADVLLSSLGMLVLFPLFVIVGVLVRFSSPGPVLFRQLRVGRRGCDFTLFKFRTMTVRKKAELGEFDAGSRARVTRVGRFLRRAKIDELPQLWNVLKGDMSLVGPRPEIRKWTEVYSERWVLVHSVRPGMTDPASICFRNEEEILASSPNPEETYRLEILPKKLEMYENYVRTLSLAGDLKILFRTLGAVWKSAL